MDTFEYRILELNAPGEGYPWGYRQLGDSSWLGLGDSELTDLYGAEGWDLASTVTQGDSSLLIFRRATRGRDIFAEARA